MASKIKNVELLTQVFGHQSIQILQKLENDEIKLKNKSSKFVMDLANTILNYVDFIYGGNISVIENKSVIEIQKEYSEWVINNKNVNTTLKNLKEEHIIFDYRINDVGYYWVDLETNYSSKMMFDMNNCGRVGTKQNLMVLKNKKNINEVTKCVAIVISDDHYIIQIKGNGNSKPLNFYNYIFDFLINYNPILGFRLVFKPEDDFTKFDLTQEDITSLKLKKPHLFNKFI
jgi:hypothetical protein